MKPIILNKKMIDFFWSRVKTAKRGCWLWYGHKKNGYGSIGKGAKMYYAHRISYTIANGAIPNGLCICHRCDNPLCTNPQHLFAASQRSNSLDMWNKGRAKTTYTSGEIHHSTKLLDSEVEEIRFMASFGWSHKAIASIYGVSRSNVSLIVKGESRVLGTGRRTLSLTRRAGIAVIPIRENA